MFYRKALTAVAVVLLLGMAVTVLFLANRPGRTTRERASTYPRATESRDGESRDEKTANPPAIRTLGVTVQSEGESTHHDENKAGTANSGSGGFRPLAGGTKEELKAGSSKPGDGELKTTEFIKEAFKANGFTVIKDDVLCRKGMTVGELRSLLRKCTIDGLGFADCNNSENGAMVAGKEKLLVIARVHGPTNSMQYDETLVDVTLYLNAPGPGPMRKGRNASANKASKE